MDIRQIKDEIVKLENGHTSYSTVEKLAVLYTVHDHLSANDTSLPIEQSLIVDIDGNSEFIKSAVDVPLDALLTVLDEHMECIRALYPKEYDAVCRKLRCKTGN